MKKILLIAYYYPPLNNAGTQRLETWAKQLPDLGVKTFILTSQLFAKEKSFDAGNVYRAFDLQKLFSSTQDTNTGFRETSLGFGQKLKYWLFWPDTKVLWLPFALFKAWRIIRREKIEQVLVSFPPASSLVLGWLLKLTTGKKLISDFRDPWLLDPLDPNLRQGLKRQCLTYLEKLIVKHSDLVLTTAPDSQKYYQRLSQAKDKVKLLTNGYNEKDFIFAQKNLDKFKTSLDFKPEDFFVISHTGALHNSHPGNTPRHFWQALKKVLERHPDWKAKVKVVFVGNLTAQEKAWPKKLGLEKVSIIKDQVSHWESIAWRLVSDLQLLIDAPKPERSAYIQGKVFEHLRAQKPILALLPAGSSRDFIKKHQIGICLKPDNVPKITEALEDLIAQRKGLVASDYQKFERHQATKKLAKWLDS